MKKIVINLFSLAIFLILNQNNLFCQIPKNFIDEYENKIESNWINILIGKQKWDLIHKLTFNKKNIISYDSIINSNDKLTMKFQYENINILPFRLIWNTTRTKDTIKDLGIKYFQSEKTFFAFKTVPEPSGNVDQRFAYRLIFIKGIIH